MQVNELKAEMARKNKTQKDIAQATNKKEATICRNFKSGYMTIDDAKKIADLLELSLERRAEIFLK